MKINQTIVVNMLFLSWYIRIITSAIERVKTFEYF